MVKRLILFLIMACGVLVSLIGRPAPGNGQSKSNESTPMMTSDKNGLLRYTSPQMAKVVLRPNIPPASCDEWATQSTPIGSIGQKCGEY